MDVLLGHCNLELEVEAADIEAAKDSLTAVMLGMYLSGLSPTLAPFGTTHSLNDYSGINSRDSDHLRARLSAEQRAGFRSDQETVEAWPIQLSMACNTNPAALLVSEDQFKQASSNALKWLDIEASQPALRVVRDVAHSAPMLPSTEQALLHVWCALEALFPKVSAEVSFRIALYLTQLATGFSERFEYFNRVRQAYNLRSRLAHGSTPRVEYTQWLDAWGLLLDAGNAIVERGRLPTEDDLLAELLTPARGAKQ